VIPACNEAATLEASVRALLRTEYPDVEIVIVEDRSSDGTGALADRLAAEDSRIRVVHVKELPAGWLGKVHALHCGAQAATGAWMLFCDADVHLSPRALSKAIAWCESRSLDFLSALPAMERATLVVDAAVAVVLRCLVGGSRAWAVEDPKSTAVFGVGVFLLVRRSAFDRTEGFPWLRLDVADDVALALLMKRSGARCSLVHASEDISIKVYDSAGQMVRALEKNSYSIMGRCSPLRTVAYGLSASLLELGLFAAFVPVGLPWLPMLSALGLAVAALAAVKSACWHRAPFWVGLLFPLGGALLSLAAYRAAWVGWRQGGVVWRGTLYSAAELRAGMRVKFPE